MLLRPLLRSALTLLPCIRVTVLPCSPVTLFPFLLFFLSSFLSAQVGKVGINTTTPAAMLHVMDSSVLFSGASTTPNFFSPPPVSGQGNRMMWYAGKSAFRAGRVDGTAWDKDSVGLYSVAFGYNAKAKGENTFVGGGGANNAVGSGSAVIGGAGNTARSLRTFVGGGFTNTAIGAESFVGGGAFNATSGSFAFVGGGRENIADTTSAFVGGGEFNEASGLRSFIGGGSNNAASMDRSFVGGGIGNLAGAGNAFVGGGNANFAGGLNAFVGGGDTNVASGAGAFVGGGDESEASGLSSFVGGGVLNIASGAGAFVGGGNDNSASGVFAFVGGGYNNSVSGNSAFVGGGHNLLSKSYCEAVLGINNTDYTPASAIGFNANDRLFVIGNGSNTQARSNAVTVLKNGRVGFGTDTPDLLVEIRGPASAANGATLALGGTGSDQVESGRIRFLEGTASTNWRGTYLHLDGSANLFHIGVHSPNTNLVTDDVPVITIERGSNQVGIGTTTPGFLLEVDGSAGKPGGGSWSASSDARLKTDVEPYKDGLRSVLAIDPVTYRYNSLSGYDTNPTHVGVIAQQLQEVTPYMVSVSDRVATDGSTGYLAVDNSAMTYMLINAVKEQQAIIEELKRTIEALSAEMAEVKARGAR